MLVNSSSNSSLHPPPNECLQNKGVMSVYTVVFISSILLFPVLILVLYVGFQRWRKQRSVATSAKMSHSDIFTFHIVVPEMICALGSCFFCCGAYTNQRILRIVGSYLYGFVAPGQTLLHLLTCVERYLAVCHPITYVRLRQSGGAKIRNISIGGVWLFCFGSLYLSNVNLYFNLIYSFLFLFLSSTVVALCSFSVLWTLNRPGPGEVGGNRKRVDRSKQRAFYTMVVIMGTLSLRFSSTLVALAIRYTGLSKSVKCIVESSAILLNLPSSLVLPLQFLHRAGKLPSCKNNTDSGWGLEYSAHHQQIIWPLIPFWSHILLEIL